MATIKRTTRTDEQLTILSVNGFVKYDEVIHAIHDFYEHDVTPYLLWDFTEADLSGITRNDIENIILAAKSKTCLRKNGRTAFLVHHDLSFGLSRMYEILSEINQHPIVPHVFKNMEEAMAWLKPTK